MIEKDTNNTMNDPFFESLSPTDFKSTVDRISKEVVNKSWSIMHIYDLQETLKKHGKEVLPATVLSICQPKHSSRILEKDTERIVSTMMPCRISVYEKNDGKCYISRINPSIMTPFYGGIIEEVMSESAHEVEEIIEQVLRVK